MMFIFVAYKSRYCHKNRQYSDYLYMLFSFLKEFSWWKINLFPQKNGISLWSSISWPEFVRCFFWKLSLFAVQSGVLVFRNFSWTFYCILLESSIRSKITWKVVTWTIFYIINGLTRFFKILDAVLLPLFCTLKQTLHPVSPVDVSQVIGFQIIIWYNK